MEDVANIMDLLSPKDSEWISAISYRTDGEQPSANLMNLTYAFSEIGLQTQPNVFSISSVISERCLHVAKKTVISLEAS